MNKTLSTDLEIEDKTVIIEFHPNNEGIWDTKYLLDQSIPSKTKSLLQQGEITRNLLIKHFDSKGKLIQFLTRIADSIPSQSTCFYGAWHLLELKDEIEKYLKYNDNTHL